MNDSSERFDDAALQEARRLESAATGVLVRHGLTEKQAILVVESIVSAVMCRIVSAWYAATHERLLR